MFLVPSAANRIDDKDVMTAATTTARFFIIGSNLSSQCPEHCEDVFDGSAALNVMNRVKDVAVLWAENPDAFFDLFFNFFGSAEGKSLLSIDAASPKDNPVAKFIDQILGVHACRRALNGVEDVVSGLDKTIDEGSASTAAMLYCLPFCMEMNPVTNFFSIRQV
jgi:hypothetical protein